MKRILAEYAATPEAKAINPSRHGLEGLILLGYSRFQKMREPTEEHIHPDILEIGFCERKSLVLNASGVDYPLMPGDFFVNQPNSPHHLESRPAGLAYTTSCCLDQKTSPYSDCLSVNLQLSGGG